ncbi:IQ-domain-containing protein, partial [Trifolium medium]|nr:IQ-domain-containing protein [Trifolium medium]
MGKKGNWFSNVKKALSPDSKKSSKSKKKWFGKEKLQTS